MSFSSGELKALIISDIKIFRGLDIEPFKMIILYQPDTNVDDDFTEHLDFYIENNGVCLTLMKDNVPIRNWQGPVNRMKQYFAKEIARAKDGSKLIEIVKKKEEVLKEH
jgi:hypothetical protein